jgi:arylsulfatase
MQLIAAVLLLLAATLHAAGGKPNLVFILADDLGFSDLGCHGSEIATPNLDALARDGLRFTEIYNTGRCWPSRAALLTGYYPQQIHRDRLPATKGGVNGLRPPWARALPDFLAAAGYRSYHSGKWHIDGKVLDAGFHRSLKLDGQGCYFSGEKNEIDDRPAPDTRPGYYSTTATADHAIACLKEHASAHTGKPFFHFIGFTAPHFPLHALPGDIAKYRGRYAEGWDSLRDARFRRLREIGIVQTTLSALEPDLGPPYAFPKDIPRFGPGEIDRPLPWTSLTRPQREFQATKMEIHAAMIDRMDQEIGRILDQLKAMDAFDNTVIFFASDNGCSAEIMIRGKGHDPALPPGSEGTYLCLGPGFSSAANTPFRRHKVWVHEGGIATPFIVHWPKGIKDPGSLRHTVGHFIDFVPTALELAGIEKPGTWNGKPIPTAPGLSLAPAFNDATFLPPRRLWWLHEGNRAMRAGDWKLVAAKNQPWELYNLKTDRAEQHNLITKHPEKARDLETAWNELTDEFSALIQSKH